jgi:hypothetical protein
LNACSNLFRSVVFILLWTNTILCFSQFADGCQRWTTVKEDTVTGQGTWVSKEALLVTADGGKTGLSIYSFLNSSGKVIIVSIQAIGAGKCVDKGDKINILFYDGNTLDLSNTNDFNCDGSSTLYFGGGLGKHDEMKLLLSKKVKTMRVWTRDDYMQVDFNDADATAFSETLKCLANALRH